jgi:F-type H+-transporting ATPase subunit epsilon
MKLQLTSLGNFVSVQEDIVSLRAEDASGSFGIWPGHADFLTVLEVGVVSWRHPDGHEQHCAVRRGVLRVQGGGTIEIATREAIVDDDLERLESTVLAEFHAREQAERSSRTEATRFELQALREMMRYLQPERGAGPGRRR